MSETAAAVKIQKVCRGYLSRKSLRTILEIGRAVGEVERTVSGSGFSASVQEDPKERLRVSEALMGLLLRLDSVRGFDVGVRNCRKEVIKKAIRLQESVDSMASSSGGDDNTGFDEKDAATETEGVSSMDIDDASVLTGCCKDWGNGETDVGEPTDQNHPPEESKSRGSESDVSVSPDEPEGQPPMGGGTGDGEKIIEVVSCGGVGELGPQDQPKTVTDLSDGERNGGIMERLMEENARLAGLVAELNERNALQTQLMGSLVKRVERLEQALKPGKLKRKKNKTRWCVVDAPGSKELEEYSLV